MADAAKAGSTGLTLRGLCAGVALAVALSLPVTPSAAFFQNTGEAESAAADASSDGEAASDEEMIEAAAIRFLDDLLEAAVEIKNNDSYSEAERYDAFQTLLSEGLAIESISNFMLSKSHRDAATPEQLQAYKDVFPEYITRIYADQLSKLAEVNMRVTETRSNANSGAIIVRTRIDRTNGDPVTVDWRITETQEKTLKIVDIIVEGASIMFVKREEFNSLVSQQGLDSLIAVLQERSQEAGDAVL